MKKYYTLLFSSMLLASLTIKAPNVKGDVIIYDPLNPANSIEPLEPSDVTGKTAPEDAAEESSTSSSDSTAPEESQSTTTEESTPSSSEKKEPKKKKPKYTPKETGSHMKIEQMFLIPKVTVEKNLIQPDDTGGGDNPKSMFQLAEMSYLLSGLAVYGKKAEGGIEQNVQNIFG